MAFNPLEPYDDLPLLPPGTEVETKAVLRRAMSASRALAELKGSGGLIPDQSILINAIPLQEAKASSEIENIVTTNDALYKAADIHSTSADPQTKEVLRYRNALWRGYESVKAGDLSLSVIRSTCSVLRDKDIDFRSEVQKVIIGNKTAKHVTYTPPRGGEALLVKLRDLEDFLLRRDGFDPIIRMAVAHYQFEAIHPFDDGNGRTGRILNILYLVHTGLLAIPVLYLSGNGQ
jgi:Fic family protein